MPKSWLFPQLLAPPSMAGDAEAQTEKDLAQVRPQSATVGLRSASRPLPTRQKAAHSQAGVLFWR